MFCTPSVFHADEVSGRKRISVVLQSPVSFLFPVEKWLREVQVAYRSSGLISELSAEVMARGVHTGLAVRRNYNTSDSLCGSGVRPVSSCGPAIISWRFVTASQAASVFVSVA